MSKRPISVTIAGWLFVVVGVAGVAFHANEPVARHRFHYDAMWVLALSVLAAVCGVYMLKRSNWARWVAVGWLVFHVGISAFHTPKELIMHSVLLVVLAYVLFRPQATRYFRGAVAERRSE